MFAANTSASGRQNFCLTRNKLAKQLGFFEINVLNVFLAKIAGFFHIATEYGLITDIQITKINISKFAS